MLRFKIAYTCVQNLTTLALAVSEICLMPTKI